MEKEREIKFKFYNKKDNFVTKNPFRLGEISFNNNEEEWIPLQYTGLKDNNDGTEIYEGNILEIKVNVFAGYDHNGDDIYQIETTYSPVVFKNGVFGVRLDPWDCDHISWSEFGDGDTVEVIGNIYENKELL